MSWFSGDLMNENSAIGDGRSQRREPAAQCKREEPGTDPAPSLLRCGADGQAPGDPRGPESIGQMIARCEDAERVNEVSDRPVDVNVANDARCRIRGIKPE